jgi:hypothetical protein
MGKTVRRVGAMNNSKYGGDSSVHDPTSPPPPPSGNNELQLGDMAQDTTSHCDISAVDPSCNARDVSGLTCARTTR